MKKFVIILGIVSLTVIFIAFASVVAKQATEGSKPKVLEAHQIEVRGSAESGLAWGKVLFEGHVFIVVKGMGTQMGVTHDPTCPCGVVK